MIIETVKMDSDRYALGFRFESSSESLLRFWEVHEWFDAAFPKAPKGWEYNKTSLTVILTAKEYTLAVLKWQQ